MLYFTLTMSPDIILTHQKPVRVEGELTAYAPDIRNVIRVAFAKMQKPEVRRVLEDANNMKGLVRSIQGGPFDKFTYVKFHHTRGKNPHDLLNHRVERLQIPRRTSVVFQFPDTPKARGRAKR